MNMPIYSSKFANTILDMHCFRESLGNSRNTYASELKDFDRFCAENHPFKYELTKELALEWAAKRPNERINNHRVRIFALRQLARNINYQGFRAYIIPTDIIENPERFELYLFTDEDLRTFFQEIDTLTVSQKGPFSEYTLPVFFPIAYGCGLRPNELYNLRRYIYNSKTRRDRLEAITNDLTELCEKYDRLAEKLYPNNIGFFTLSQRVLTVKTGFGIDCKNTGKVLDWINDLENTQEYMISGIILQQEYCLDGLMRARIL